MDLKTIYEKLDDIPESVNFRELFTEKDGKFELTGLNGVKTEADVTRLSTALHKAQQDNKKIKEGLKVWEGWDREEIQGKLDRMEELEAAAGDKLDDAKLDELANKRAEGILKTKLSPLERQIRDLSKQNGELGEMNGKLLSQADTRRREDLLRPHMIATKVLPEHHEDVFLYAERHLEKTEDGQFIAREGIDGITPGLTPKEWLAEMLERKPGWLPPSEGSGAVGSRARGSFGGTGKNPWSAADWNLTEQGKVVKALGIDKATQLATLAGSKIGGSRPLAAKKTG